MKRLFAPLVALWLRITNRYEGAGYSTGRSWLDSSYTSARFDITQSTREQIVRKSRFFEQNSDIMQRAADLFECYTVGPSFQIQPASSDPEWNRKAKAWWDRWATMPDVASRQHLSTLLGLVARSWFTDGEVFINKTRGDSGIPRVQLLETQLCQTPEGSKDDPNILDGVELDARTGRPVAYYFGEETKPGQFSGIRRVPAYGIIHVMEPCRPGQIRGLPFCYAVINTLHDLDDLQKLEMRAAKIGASVANVATMKTGEVDAKSLRGGGTAASRPADRTQAVKDVTGPETIILNEGETFQQFATERPSLNMQEFWKQLTMKVSSGIGIPYVLLYPETMQGTVYRGALDMSAVWFRSRHAVIAAAAQEIWEYVMGWAVKNPGLTGLENAPADWFKTSIRAPRAPNVDVGRNSAAQIAELEAGITSPDEIYGPRGLDPYEEARKKAEWIRSIRAIATEYGVAPEEIAAGVKSAASPQLHEPRGFAA